MEFEVFVLCTFQVLRCFLGHVEYIYDHTGRAKWEAAKQVSEQVIEIYARAHIPTISQKKIQQKICNLYEQKYRSLAKMGPTKRAEAASQLRIKKFQQELDITMKFWPENVESMLLEEDRLFLESMKTDRKASMGTKDIVFNKQQKKKQDRYESANARIEKESKRNGAKNKVTWDEVQDLSESDSETDNFSGQTMYSTPQAPRSHHRNKKTGTAVFIPHDVLRQPAFVSSLVRNGISPTATVASLETLISACDGDVSRVNLSYATAQRYDSQAYDYCH